MNNPIYCGIDVAKRSLVIGLSNHKKIKTQTNNPKGIAQILDYLCQVENVTLVTLEATRGLEIPLAKALTLAGFRVLIANPQKRQAMLAPKVRRKLIPRMRLTWHFMGKIVTSRAKQKACFMCR